MKINSNESPCKEKDCVKLALRAVQLMPQSFIISSTDINVIDTNFVSTTINGVEGTDHPYGLTATFKI
jgi:hypothetical protein